MAIGAKGDAYGWWRANANKYPHVSKIALSLLGIVGTSVDSERLFSKAGQIVTVRRANLLPHRLEKIVFLHCNLRKPTIIP